MLAGNVDPEEGDDDLLLVEANAWTNLKSQKRVRSVSLSVGKGLWSSFDSSLRIEAKELVGVHLSKDGKRLRFVGYRHVRSKAWFNRPKTPVRIEVLLVATGKRSAVENQALARNWYLAGLRLLRRTEESLLKPLLVLVNPASGNGKAQTIWEKECQQVICADGGHRAKVIVTEREHHATEFIRDHPNLCRSYKGIVVVSGDGGVHEALQGVMARPDWAVCVRELTLGVIPAGTRNGLAKSISVSSRVPLSPKTAASIIAHGASRALDICTVDVFSKGPAQPPQRHYSFSFLGCGAIADAYNSSVCLRRMSAYNPRWQGVLRLFSNRYYRGKLSYCPVENRTLENGNSSSLSLSSPNCTSEVNLLAKDSDATTLPWGASESSGVVPRSPPRTPKGVRRPMRYWEVPGAPQAGPPALTQCPEMSSPLPENWISVEGSFWHIWNCNLAFMSSQDNAAPHSKMDDGYIQLQWIPKGSMNTWQKLQFILGLDAGLHTDNSLVHMAPSRAYRLEPEPSKDKKEDFLTIDGERIPFSSVQIENFRGLWKVFNLSATP